MRARVREDPVHNLALDGYEAHVVALSRIFAPAEEDQACVARAVLLKLLHLLTGLLLCVAQVGNLGEDLTPVLVDAVDVHVFERTPDRQEQAAEPG